MPDELLARASSRQITELEALFVVKEEERRRDEWRQQINSLGKDRPPRRR